MPARLMTSPHFFESDAISLPNCSGVPPPGSLPVAAFHLAKAGDAMARLAAPLSASRIGRGRPAGAMTPT